MGSRQLNEVNVTGARLDNSSNSRLLLDIKGSLQVLNGISAETINRTTDKDASEIIRRISGVSVNLNKFAVVRGLNERYNTTMLNDLVAPSTEPDKKSFSFDIVPANLIEKILVYKTASADMPGDFAGGLIKIFTRTPDMGKKLIIELNGYYNEYTTFHQVQYTDKSSVDFLGSGAKYRAMPAGVPDYIQSSSSNLTKLFKNNWEVHQQAASPDLRIGATYSAGGKIGHSFLGSVTAINYYSHSNIYDVHKNEYETPVATLIPDEPTKDYTDHQSIKNVLLSGIQNFNVSFNERNNLEFKNLFSRTGINQTILRNGTDEDTRIREYSFGYEQRTLYSSQLSYTTRGIKDKDNYNAIVGFSYNQRLNPDLRNVFYQMPPDTVFGSNIAPGSGTIDPTDGATRQYRKLNEYMYSFSQVYHHSIVAESYKCTLGIGSYVEFKDREFNTRTLGYTLPASLIRRHLIEQSIGQMFTDQNIDAIDSNRNIAAGFRINENTSPSNSYTGTNMLLAGFATTEFSWKKNLFLKVGLRLEDNTQFIHTVVGVDTVNPSIHTQYYLPSLNLKYFLTGNSNLHIAYAETLNRPEFREWSPMEYYDFEMMALSHGTLTPSVSYPQGFTLKTATIQNFDLKYELYPRDEGIVAVGVFYKHFQNPIELTIENREHRTGVSREITFRNSPSAFCAGLELEAQRSLSFLTNSTGWNMFNRLSININATLVNSAVNNSNDTLVARHQLQGQAPYMANLGLSFETPKEANKLQVTAFYNVLGPRIYLVGGNDGPGTQSGPSIGEMQRHVVDILMRKNFSSKLSVSLGVSNILNSAITLRLDDNNDGKFRKADKEISIYRPGRILTLGLRVIL